VIHDYSLGRTTSGHGLVALSQWERLRTLDAGAWFDRKFAGQRLLELSDCLQQVLPSIPVNVEIKGFFGKPEKLVKAALAAIRKASGQRRVLVTSFNHKAVAMVEEQMPEVALGLLFHPLVNGRPRQRHLDWLTGRADKNQLPFEGRALVVDHSLATPELVEQAHRRSGVVLVYTVNEEKEMRRLMGYRVDGLITNFPARYRSLLARA
jgi:glycerophosphoryl diester phosphodiesterase